MTRDPVGAGHSETRRRTTVVDDTKIDALGVQLSDLRVLVAQVAGDTRAILARLDSIDRSLADHELRIRELESHGTGEHGARIDDLHDQMAELREWRQRVLGLAAGVGAGVGAVTGGGIAVIARVLGQ